MIVLVPGFGWFAASAADNSLWEQWGRIGGIWSESEDGDDEARVAGYVRGGAAEFDDACGGRLVDIEAFRRDDEQISG